MESMTGRERMIMAMRNLQPDRIPAAPDISVMIPTRLTGKPFWELEINENPPIWKAYTDAMKYFGIDGWLVWGRLDYTFKSQVTFEKKIIRRDPERWDVQTIIHTPDGDLSMVLACPFDNPATLVEKPVKNLNKDFKKLRHLFSDVTGYDKSIYLEQKKEIGENGIICCYIDPPGFQNYVDLFHGGLEEISYAYYDYPELFLELVAMHEKVAVKKMEMAIDAGVESILTGGSGSITLQSPELFRKLSLPTIKKITKMSREAGIISGIHSCGKEYAVVEACANETHLDYINPLEISPMGDCDLATIKKNFGDKLCLMGNLHTSNVMLHGSVNDVRRESLKAIRDAGMNGGFILSSGDQCGRDTPFENIFEMVKVAREYGTYPLDIYRIDAEIKRLENI